MRAWNNILTRVIPSDKAVFCFFTSLLATRTLFYTNCLGFSFDVLTGRVLPKLVDLICTFAWRLPRLLGGITRTWVQTLNSLVMWPPAALDELAEVDPIDHRLPQAHNSASPRPTILSKSRSPWIDKFTYQNKRLDLRPWPMIIATSISTHGPASNWTADVMQLFADVRSPAAFRATFPRLQLQPKCGIHSRKVAHYCALMSLRDIGSDRHGNWSMIVSQFLQAYEFYKGSTMSRGMKWKHFVKRLPLLTWDCSILPNSWRPCSRTVRTGY